MARQLLEQEILENGNMVLRLTPDAVEEISELQEKGYTDQDILIDLLEFQFSNGFTNITGNAGLTESVVIAQDMAYNEETDEEYVDDETKVWFYPDYMIRDYVEQLLEEKELIFTYVR
jgi:hypothetical protein